MTGVARLGPLLRATLLTSLHSLKQCRCWVDDWWIRHSVPSHILEAVGEVIQRCYRLTRKSIPHSSSRRLGLQLFACCCCCWCKWRRGNFRPSFGVHPATPIDEAPSSVRTTKHCFVSVNPLWYRRGARQTIVSQSGQVGAGPHGRASFASMNCQRPADRPVSRLVSLQVACSTLHQSCLSMVVTPQCGKVCEGRLRSARAFNGFMHNYLRDHNALV